MTFAGRPHAHLGIAELERLVRNGPDHRATNQAILAELAHRTVPRAQALERRLTRMLGAGEATSATAPANASAPQLSLPLASVRPAPAPPLPAPPLRVPPIHVSPVRVRPASPPKPAAPLPDRDTIDDDPQDILRAWTVMEVLSPATFTMPATLAGDPRNVARFDRGLPWAGGLAKGPPNRRLYFQIVLGSVVMRPAIDALLHRFADERPERPQARGETPLAVVIVDREGRPIPDACAVVSSFAWGLARALAGDPASLARWPDEENELRTALHERLYREGADGKVLPLDGAAIDSAYGWLVGALGLDPSMLKPPSFAVRSTVPFKSKEPPEALLLNSFFLQDLGRAAGLFRAGKAPDTLRRFLGALPPDTRRDLLRDEAAIEAVVAPERFPSRRWPGSGRHPLALMQQAAVNLAAGQGPGEILAVNGPPGIGKTTLLRDIVAALVTARAGVMAGFDDPEKAFTASGAKLNHGGAWTHLYRVDPRLKGFEMLVASSNNKAVENVSGELPASGAIAVDAGDLRYLKPMADGLLGGEGWGAIAAVLGNAGNRHAFKQRFWWDEDTGLFNYFKAIDGRKPEVTLRDGGKRLPRIVTELDPPLDRRDALRRWQAARTRFRTLERQVATTRGRVELLRLGHRHLPALERAFAAVREHGAQRPGLLARLFGGSYRRWRRAHEPLSSTLADAGRQAAKAKLLRPELSRLLSRSPWFGFRASTRAAAIDGWLGPALSAWRHERESRPAVAVDDEFFGTGADNVQPSSPWFTVAEHRERDALFQASLDLHRAFIDAAAKPLWQNLGAALQVIDGKGLGDASKDELIPDLWSSLFLVVPALSTTFASVGTMLARMPPASFGWLLVDEAGQASPQQAVGALMRAGRAIVVGDPIQVPPVVMLPDRLTAAICRSFGVDAARFSAPAASVQTLADDATAWFAEFPARMGSRTVGVPLLVHRRCADPMFGIANRVAYENLMVQAKRPRPSAIRDLLGPSCWIDVVGSGTDKWCAEEGREAVALLEQIVA